MEEMNGKVTSSVAVSVKNLILRYNLTSEPALNDIDMELKRAALLPCW
jgi:hypothetical protein